ncbi:hypothetical protein EV356DRAFT_141853 [Viridothelium virens]|uniref:Uncharacterized protein n=1 Tax=Viridothelium virens TaxID=1048519 RepID=A0A6A6H9I0_VIRVR|nr:hypothetical protein EV356DRAFT_141853 [Viridothelium virens]
MLHAKAKTTGDVIGSTNELRDKLDIERAKVEKDRADIAEYCNEMERQHSGLRVAISKHERDSSIHKASITRLHEENNDLRRHNSSTKQELKSAHDSNKLLEQKLNEKVKASASAEHGALMDTIYQTKRDLDKYIKELIGFASTYSARCQASRARNLLLTDKNALHNPQKSLIPCHKTRTENATPAP